MLGINVGHKCWAHMLGTNVGHKCWAQMLGTNVGHKCWAQMLGTNVGHKCWAQMLGTNVGHKCWAGEKENQKNPNAVNVNESSCVVQKARPVQRSNHFTADMYNQIQYM